MFDSSLFSDCLKGNACLLYLIDARKQTCRLSTMGGRVEKVLLPPSSPFYKAVGCKACLYVNTLLGSTSLNISFAQQTTQPPPAPPHTSTLPSIHKHIHYTLCPSLLSCCASNRFARWQSREFTSRETTRLPVHFFLLLPIPLVGCPTATTPQDALLLIMMSRNPVIKPTTMSKAPYNNKKNVLLEISKTPAIICFTYYHHRY